MKKKHSKKHELGKTNKMFQKILATISLLLTFGYGTIAQNVTYDSAWFAINGDYNTAIGYGILKSNISGSHNTATGYTALFSNTKGTSNVANGHSALYSNTEGSNNTAHGFYALYSNTTGNYNTGTGMYALEFNTTGEYNTALGYYSLAGSTSSTGNRNTAIGASALQSNSTGMENTALGMRALRDNTTGNSNVANGCYSLLLNTTGYSNTGNGFYALYTNKTGFGNTALGYFADVKSDNLTNATAIGYTAKVAESNTIQLGNNSVVKVYAGTGNNATLIAGGLQITGGTPGVGKVLTSDANGIATWQAPMGGGSGWALTGNTGTVDGTNFIGTTDNIPFNIRVNNQKAGRIDHKLFNTSYGYESANFNTTGSANTVTGYQALYANATGWYNTANGYATLYYTSGNHNTGTGYRALKNNAEGNGNTAMGSDALLTNNTGSNNTALGFAADVSMSNLTNATAIGSGAKVNASNKIRLGDVNVTLVESSGAFMTVSDGRFKTNISEKDVKGLEFIKRLRPVVYNFDTKRFQNFLNQTSENKLSTSTENQDFQISTDIRQSGFIAQEVEKAAEEAGYNFNGIHKPINEKDNYSLGYSQFVVPLVKAVQELNEKNEQLQTQLENILQQLNELKNNQKENTTPSSNLKVYPNPTSDSFTLTATYDLKEARIQLVDMFGNIKNITTQDIDKYSKKIYVKNINTGVYILLITTNTKIEQTEIVIE